MPKPQTLPKISLSDKAPAETVSFNFATVQFELVGKKTFETLDSDALAAAEMHDWLTVKYPETAPVVGAYREQIAPEDDPFSSLGSPVNPNDPAQAQAAEADKYPNDDIVRVAIDVTEPQTEVVVLGDTATTLAADPTSKTSSNVKDKD